MHELSIANAIVKACVERASGGRIPCIRVEVGRLAAMLPDSLRFCFEFRPKDTLAGGATLEILETPGRATCGTCCSITLSSPREGARVAAGRGSSAVTS
jgi:hydrogenase nickel incorporation protein HypA/HybF